jgi:hypothetical protein
MPYLLRTWGGPYDGQTRVVDVRIIPWPFDDELPVPEEAGGGKYVKTSESKLSIAAAEHPNVAMTANYRYRPPEQ